ncbi:thioredoxin [Patescibacteria group bacterium]|nr:thioredoxin [Patescibacteria group bacterium]
MSHLNGTKQNFQSEVIDYQGSVLVDFWASWCGPCQMLSPIIDEIGNELKEKVKIVKVDVDAENELASIYNVSAIPTVIVFKNGQIVDTIVGFRQKQDYLSAINQQ